MSYGDTVSVLTLHIDNRPSSRCLKEVISITCCRHNDGFEAVEVSSRQIDNYDHGRLAEVGLTEVDSIEGDSRPPGAYIFHCDTVVEVQNHEVIDWIGNALALR